MTPRLESLGYVFAAAAWPSTLVAVTAERLLIDVPGKVAVSALLDRPTAASGLLVIYAPGAGSSLADPFGARLAERLPASGYGLLRFQFPYTEAGRRLPDANPVLEATWGSAIETACTLAGRIVAGGRSMGGRIASQVAAHGLAVDGLALFAYPLHPPGRPQQTRDAHLGAITVPTLFCSGTRDTFAAPEELSAAAAKVRDATVHFLEGADHGFNVAKATGRTKQDIWDEAAESLLAFLADL